MCKKGEKKKGKASALDAGGVLRTAVELQASKKKKRKE